MDETDVAKEQNRDADVRCSKRETESVIVLAKEDEKSLICTVGTLNG